MPLYSKIISNDEILGLVVGKYSKILLVACGGCMNESLAYDYNLPLTIKKAGRYIHPAISVEFKRIANMLYRFGISTDMLVLPPGSNSRCMININEPMHPILEETFQPVNSDAMLVLSCPSGFYGITCQVRGIQPYLIARQKGTLSYIYDIAGDSTYIVEGKVSFFEAMMLSDF